MRHLPNHSANASNRTYVAAFATAHGFATTLSVVFRMREITKLSTAHEMAQRAVAKKRDINAARIASVPSAPLNHHVKRGAPMSDIPPT
jgi:hypothetical protein